MFFFHYNCKNISKYLNNDVYNIFLIIMQQADLAIADITITRQREHDVDFTSPFMNLGICVMLRKI